MSSMLKRRLALVAQDFEHGRAAFLGHFDPRIVQVHHVHLKRLHEKVLVVPTTGTGQRHRVSSLVVNRFSLHSQSRS